MRNSFYSRITSEPLLIILLIGGLLFLAQSALSPKTKEVIEIKPELVLGLENAKKVIVGRPLTDEERKIAVEAYIDDEILLREAYKRGFDRTDPRVRKRLLSVMRYTLDEDLPEPSVAQLKAYYKDRQDKYKVGESISFDQVFFFPDSDKAPEDPKAFLERLAKGQRHASLGDRPFFGMAFRRQLTKRDLAREFGRRFAGKVFDLKLDTWTGPIESNRGIHYVRLKERHPPFTPPFDKIERYVRQEWEFNKRRAIQDKKIAEMRKNYRILRPDQERRKAE